MTSFAKILIISGIMLIIAGIILWLTEGRTGWLGHLPGDIRIEKENFSFYFPITTMIIISIVVSIILWLVRKLF
jgi:ribose/xylose/arabinose/galactoside ABC-type transport system permease subunit